MTILLENECSPDLSAKLFQFDAEKTAEDVTEAFLDCENCPYEASVSITITDDASIREINREHRGIDAATDVLSFPMIQYPAPADFDILEDADDAFDPDSGELLLGDIVLSADHILAQARAYGHSLRREYAFLIPQRRVNRNSQRIPARQFGLIALPFLIRNGFVLRILND